jgi:hypothetical protein
MFSSGTYAILLGKPKFVTFVDEIHNKLGLMKRLNGRGPASMFCVSFFWGKSISIKRLKYLIIPN